MASFKSASVFSSVPWSGGLVKRRYSVILTDNNAVDHEIIGMPVKVDEIDDGSATGARYLSEHADREILDAVKGAFEGISPETISPIWNTQQEFDIRVVGRMMMVRDSQAFLASLSHFQGIESRGGANANQRAEYLGVVRQVYDLIANRYGDVQGAAFFLTDEKAQIWTNLPVEFE